MKALLTPDGRRAAALIALVGGAMVFTAFAAFGVWSLRATGGFTFWLALAAHGQVFLILSALGALLVKRSFKLTRDGAEFDDKGDAT